MKHLLYAVLLILAVAAPLHATDVAGPSVVIPVAGRVAGAFGSQWQTDLIVTNASRTGSPVPVTIIFSRNDGAEQVLSTEIAPRGSAIFRDVIRDSFGQTTAFGMIRVATASPNAKLGARARIYNVGSPVGEFGQVIPALPFSKLSREAYLPGLSGVNGNRTNVGIANPGPKDAGVWLSLFEADGNFRGAFSIIVPAGTVRQYNDIFAQFDEVPGFDGATLQVTSTSGVYPYASIVRNDSGDADFIVATGAQVDDAEAIVQPECPSPAPLHLATLPANGWIVMYAAGTNATETTAALAAKYGFTPTRVYNDAFQGFFSELTQPVIAALRCEAVVEHVQQNERVPLP